MNSEHLDELKFILKLLGCKEHRGKLSLSFKEFNAKDKERICNDLGKDELIDFDRELSTVEISPPGRTLLERGTGQIPVSDAELKVLNKLAKSGKVAPSKIKVSKIKAAERDSILQGFLDRGLIITNTKLKKVGAEVWLTRKGLNFVEKILRQFQSLKGSLAQNTPTEIMSASLPFNSKITSKPSDEEILEIIKNLDQQLNTDNYLPIFYLREKLQPPLSRNELDHALYRLEQNDSIELSALQEVRSYTSEQLESGIAQDVGGSLFFIIVV